MEDGPPVFPPGFTCPVVLWIQLADFSFRIRDSHSLWCTFPCTSPNLCQYHMLSEPHKYYYSWFGLFRVRSPLLAESHFDFSSSPYLDVSVQAVPHIYLFYSVYVDRFFICRVSPFGNPRIAVCFRLTVAYRRSLRPSSAPGAKAFPLRSF